MHRIGSARLGTRKRRLVANRVVIIFRNHMSVPNRPTTGQKATITRGLNLQAATKKDVETLAKQIDWVEKQLAKQLAKAQKEVLRAIRKYGKRRRAK